MLLYTDIFTGDELFSDAYPLKRIDDFLYEVDCAMTTVGGEAINIGANPSAEDGGEALEDGAELVNNVVYSFRLQSTSFDKKSYMTYIKDYMKRLQAKLAETDPARAEEFKAKAPVHVKKILSNFGDFDFYVSESMNPEGMVPLLNYREDGVTPYFTFFAHGLKEVKL
ncbi:hypothetical protein BB560_003185 [Smittium megazygosporum]|uniref:Translationally-controlled tumor protein homolog n=1 Tax=Smittium megazygosporum TaxID=133381 RepID=A0A2T9ZCP9_9FUNG|nr:hypothetical protein BB560_003185 [Smittium megazygosporum]